MCASGRIREVRRLCMPVVSVLSLTGLTILRPFDAASITFKQLTFVDSTSIDEVAIGDPTWSPDGSRVAYSHWRRDPLRGWNVATIEIVRVEDGSTVAFPGLGASGCADLDPCQPSWSPAGDRIAFTCGGQLWSAVVDRADATRLWYDGQSPDWSPDGESIAFDAGSYYGICICFVSHHEGWCLRSPRTDNRNPAHSLVPPWFAYSAAGSIWINTYTSPSYGTPRQLTHDSSSDDHPTWSPDGQLIAFESDRSGNMDVWVVRVSNGALSRLTDDPAWDGDPAWSPDGKQIVFVSSRSGLRNLWIASDLREVGLQPARWSNVKRAFR